MSLCSMVCSRCHAYGLGYECRRLQGFCMTCGFIYVQKRQELPAKLPQKSVKLPQKTSNCRKSRKVIQSKFLEPTWSHHWLQTVWQTHGHGKFVATVATPGILNFTRKQEMLEISLKRMIQVQSMWNWSDCCAAGLIGPPSMESQWSRSYS